MKLDIILSAVVHILIVLATIAASPFDAGKKLTYDEVIHVSLAPAPAPAKVEPVPVTPPTTPQPVIEDLPEIPVNDPSTSPPVKEPEKPKPKPKPEKPKQPATKTDTKTDAEQNSGKEGEGKINSQSTAEGSPFAGATIDNASFDYPYWFNQAFNKIRANWRNPVSIGYTVTCTIKFQVIKSGRVVKTEIIQSSGIEPFDEACLRAIERAAPFPPLPREFTDEIIGITIPFQFKP